MGSTFPAVHARLSLVFQDGLALIAGSIAIDQRIGSITKILLINSFKTFFVMMFRVTFFINVNLSPS